MEIMQEDLQCSQVWSVRKALEGREFASDIHSITIDGKVGALIERDTMSFPDVTNLATIERERRRPIIFAKQLVLGLARRRRRRTDAWPPFTTLPRKRKRP